MSLDIQQVPTFETLSKSIKQILSNYYLPEQDIITFCKETKEGSLRYVLIIFNLHHETYGIKPSDRQLVQQALSMIDTTLPRLINAKDFQRKEEEVDLEQNIRSYCLTAFEVLQKIMKGYGSSSTISTFASTQVKIKIPKHLIIKFIISNHYGMIDEINNALDEVVDCYYTHNADQKSIFKIMREFITLETQWTTWNSALESILPQTYSFLEKDPQLHQCSKRILDNIRLANSEMEKWIVSYDTINITKQIRHDFSNLWKGLIPHIFSEAIGD
jgi:hypothetical protein